jgi:putative phosphoribosyl transferase
MAHENPHVEAWHKHPALDQRDLNPHAMAGPNRGIREAHPAKQGPTAYVDDAVHRHEESIIMLVPHIYKNRTEAAGQLADLLQGYANRPDVLVLALPRGGVPIAYDIAKRLNAALDLMLVRKLGVPGHEELAMGAVAAGGVRVLNEEVIRGLAISDETIARVAAVELQELGRRERAYRGQRPTPRIQGRHVILVDDGLATGATMRAAIAVVRHQQPAEVVVAVPVAPPDTIAALRQEADAVICPAMPEPFLGIGRWYEDFTQVTDEEVRALLGRAWQRQPAHEAP